MVGGWKSWVVGKTDKGRWVEELGGGRWEEEGW